MSLMDIVLKVLDIPKIEDNSGQKTSYELNNEFYHILHKDENTDLPVRDFYMWKIKQKIKGQTLEDELKRIAVCEKKSHVEDKRSTSFTNHGVYCVCKRCHLGYTRNMDTNESKSWYEHMTKRFNI